MLVKYSQTVKRILGLVAVVGFTFTVVTGCGSSDDSAEPPTTPSVATAEIPNGCLEVDQSLLDGIAWGGETTITPVAGAAVKSPEFNNAYFIAMTFSAEGVAGQTGVWTSNSLEPGAVMIMVVDPIAQQFTDWGDANNTAAKIATNDPSVDVAKSCLG